MEENKNLKEIVCRCPKCNTKLIVDSKTGTVLNTTKKIDELKKKDLSDVVNEHLEKSKKTEDLFQQLMNKQKSRDELLEEKFSNAQKKMDL